jgi:DHA2 family methylenomycin A resistance protein-like MFS transporter
VLVDGLGWRWVFAVNVPVCAVLALAAVRAIPRDRPVRPQHAFDAPAAALVTAAVALVVFGLIEGRRLGWGDSAVLGAFAAAIALTAGFVRRERGHPAPLVDLDLLRERSFVAANLGGATLYGALTGLAVYFSVFFQQVQGRSALEAGLCLLPQGALTALCAPLSGRMTARLGPRPPMLIGMAMGSAAILTLVRLEADTSIAAVWWAFALLGAGTGIALPAMTATALAAAPAAEAGMASAIHNASRQLGQTFGVAILGTIILAHAGVAAEEDARDGTPGRVRVVGHPRQQLGQLGVTADEGAGVGGHDLHHVANGRHHVSAGDGPTLSAAATPASAAGGGQVVHPLALTAPGQLFGAVGQLVGQVGLIHLEHLVLLGLSV